MQDEHNTNNEASRGRGTSQRIKPYLYDSNMQEVSHSVVILKQANSIGWPTEVVHGGKTYAYDPGSCTSGRPGYIDRSGFKAQSSDSSEGMRIV